MKNNKEEKLTIKSGTNGPQIKKGTIKLIIKASTKLLYFKNNKYGHEDIIKIIIQVHLFIHL
jgi:hypothetical protein